MVKADLAVFADAVLFHGLSGLGLCGGRSAQGADGQEDSCGQACQARNQGDGYAQEMLSSRRGAPAGQGRR